MVEKEKDSFVQRTGKKFGFLNQVSLVILVIGLIAMLAK